MPPAQPTASSTASAAPYLRRGVSTALAAAVLGVGLCTILTLVAGVRDVGPVLRTAVRGWLVAQGSSLHVGRAELGLVPFGAVLLVLALVALVAARWGVDPHAEEQVEVGPFAATVAGSSGVVAAVLASAVSTSTVTVPTVRAAFAAFVVAGLGAAVGLALGSGRPEALWFTERTDVRAVVRGAARGVVVLLSAAAAIVAVLLVWHLGRAGDLWALLQPQGGGGLVLGLVCLLSLPTLVLWTTAALVGPGFAIGTDTSLDLTGAHLGTVPGLPVLAALPSPGEFPGWVFVLGLLPLLAGVVAGWSTRLPVSSPSPLAGLVADADTDGRALLRRLGFAAAAGALAGAAVGLLVGISGGAVGPGRLAEAGPPLLTPLLVAVPVMAVGGGIGGVLAHYRGARGSSEDDTGTRRRPRLRKRQHPAGADRRDEPRDGLGSRLRRLARRGRS